jgi:PAS domain S-box-containing protein
MRILIVDDDTGIAFLISEAITSGDVTTDRLHSGADAIEYIEEHNPDILLLDYSLPDMNAGELIQELRNRGIRLPLFILSTGQGDERIAVEMMKLGAYDYLIKDHSLMQRIPSVVRRAVAKVHTEQELQAALEAKKKSDEKLQDEQRRLSNIIKATNVGTWEWNLETDETIFNEQYANIMGITLADLGQTTSATWLKITHPVDNEIAATKLDEYFNKKSDFFEVEVRVKHKNGYWVWVLSRGSVLEYSKDGKPKLMMGTLQDISDKKTRENLEKEIEVTRKTLQFKQNFLASMSHEIRTPLTGIIGIVEVLRKAIREPLLQDYIMTLWHSSFSLKEIIDQVLDYSSIESGKFRIHYKSFNTSALLDQARASFDLQPENNCILTSNKNHDVPAVISADFLRIAQVINCFVGNGVKRADNGPIEIRISKEKDIDSETIMIWVEVSDRGNEISPEKREIIFNPFSDIDKINTANYEGTGLGLAICKEIVEMHGGKIGVKTQKPSGNVFWFTFKAVLINDQQFINENETSLPCYRILFAEDKAITQKVVKLQLNEMGHQVTVVSNGKEAIDAYKPSEFDLILMDIQMPVMDGITATRQLKSLYPNLCPVIGLSANAFDGDREKYISLGLDDYINKPLQKEKFVSVVNSIFGSMAG